MRYAAEANSLVVRADGKLGKYSVGLDDESNALAATVGCTSTRRGTGCG